MPDKEPNKTDFTIAPGVDDDEELLARATQKEVDKGEYTRVTTVSLDENDPS
ncbi:hypothetical protein [Peribacillus sp. SCS-155]|uniref:hypothetical protein n=1 Tax=Peribacillus sedimenti TaxID=3115297 RepID=UPI0039066B76